LKWLTSLTMHELLWQCDLISGELGGWYPLLPALTDSELVLGTLDDYARIYNRERVTVGVFVDNVQLIKRHAASEGREKKSRFA